jgi:hypothetical protein
MSRARWALQLQRLDLPATDEPFPAVILCTADREKVDKRTRSKWSRVMRYAAEYTTNAEPLAAFVRRKGGINKCAARFTHAAADTVQTERCVMRPAESAALMPIQPASLVPGGGTDRFSCRGQPTYCGRVFWCVDDATFHVE